MSYLQLADGNDVNEFYVTIPDGYGGKVKVREDYFDRFTDSEYNEIMDTIEPSINGKAARDQRREARKAKKATKGAGARREAKQKRVETRQAAKTQRAAAGGGAGGFLDKVGGIAKNILGGVTGTAAVEGTDKSLDLTYSTEPEKKWFQNPIVIVGGVAVLGLGIYLVTKKKK